MIIFFAFCFVFLSLDHHLVHEHQGSFVAVVDLLKNLRYAFPLQLFPPFPQVVIPKLVTVEKVDEGRNI